MNATASQRKLFIGLTGGIGSGKSTVAGMLHESGAGVVDADAISRSLTASGGAAIAPIREAFGTALINAQGEMDRSAMRSLAFDNPKAKLKLEAILHPLIGAQTQHAALASEQAVVVLDIPLLVESPRWRPRLDAIWVVDCEPASQVQRVMARSGLSAEAVQRVMAAQASREQRARAADAIIYNDNINLAQLRQQVDALLAQWRSRFGL